MPTIRPEVPQERVAAFCRKWRIRELALFGSVLRDDYRADSDIDVLVTFEDGESWDLWDLAEAREELQQLFARPVDLVEKKCVTNPFRRHAILSTQQVIYAADQA
jgi:uncharacterized protein